MPRQKRQQFLIDGYNLLHALGTLTKNESARGLKRARDELLDLLGRAFTEDRQDLTVVFDATGAPRGTPAESHHGKIRVLTALGTAEADDVIEDLLEQLSQPSETHVVSDDRRLQLAARRARAHPVRCAEFIDRIYNQLAKPSPPAASKTEEREADEMSDEEKQHWLEEFKDLEPEDREFRDLF